MTELRTERLLLRRARWADLDAVHDFLTDTEAMHYWSSPPHESIDQTREWLRSMIDAPPDESDDFLMVLHGQVVGKIGAWRLPEIGFVLRSDHWGRGYAREAMRSFLDHIFARDDVDHLTADVDPRNAPSLRLLTEHAFVETGRACGTWTTHIGTCDSVYLRLDEHDWLRREG